MLFVDQNVDLNCTKKTMVRILGICITNLPTRGVAPEKNWGKSGLSNLKMG
jgi:hypothetical protein